VALVLVGCCAWFLATASWAGEFALPEEAVAKITAAAPQQATVKPAKPRKLLVFTEGPAGLVRRTDRTQYVAHKSSPYCAKALEVMGKRTGAYEAVVSHDPSMFAAQKLKAFDAVVIANAFLEGKLFRCPGRDRKEYAARQKAVLEFVQGGRGLLGIHVAAAEALGCPKYNEMLGGIHRGHAWHAHQAVPIKLDDAKHPLNAAFGGKGFTINDDIYELADPYARDRLRVLLSVDVSKAPASETDYRYDGDYPVSWIKTHGRGRVFYTALGHNPATFCNSKFLRHLLDAVQFALGDLKADTSHGLPLRPNVRGGAPATKGWTPLFDGKDLSAWKVSERQKDHWVVRDGVIRYSGRAPTLWTRDSFGDCALKVDWRMPRAGDSGVFMRGSGNGQVNIWTWAMGSGELWGQHGVKGCRPVKNADKPVGEWNTFIITMKGDRITVALNGQEVISNLQTRGLPKAGAIGLQQHGDPLEFKAIYIKKLD